MNDDVKRALIHAEIALWDGANAANVILAFLREIPSSRGKSTFTILGQPAGEIEVDWSISALVKAVEAQKP